MTRFLVAVLVSTFAVACGTARADEQEAKAVVDKAIKAMGGEEKLAKAEIIDWSGQTKMTFNDNTNEFKSHVTAKGLTHFRSEMDGEFNGNAFKGMIVLAKDKAWRKFGENQTELEGDALTNQKRNVYLQIIPATLVALKNKEFKLESTADEKVGDKPCAVVKVTAPDGKNFTLYFDKESGLPVKLTALVAGFQGNEAEQETTFNNYKDFGGIKKATKVETKRDGRTFMEQEITNFKVLDKVDADTFDEPR
jgi:hypothetical protein